MDAMFVPYRGVRAGLRMRNGEVIHRYGTTQDMKPITHKPIPPKTIPDWGLEPAASSWIRLRLPLQQREEPPRPPRPTEEREPKPRNDAGRESLDMATIMIWDLPHNVDCDELRSVFVGVDGIVAVFYSSFRHLMLIDFVTRKAAHKARGKISGRTLKNCSLKLAFFRNDKYVLNRDTSSPWAKPGTSVCIEGFDSSLDVEEIRTMLARRFGNNSEGITIPTNLDGSSIGKAYIKCGSWCSFSEALNLNGCKIGAHKLRVTECGGSRFWHGHITCTGSGTGKRKVFHSDSETE